MTKNLSVTTSKAVTRHHVSPNAAARRYFLKAHEQTKQARLFKLAGDAQSAALALSDARWYRERAKSLEAGK